MKEGVASAASVDAQEANEKARRKKCDVNVHLGLTHWSGFLHVCGEAMPLASHRRKS